MRLGNVSVGHPVDVASGAVYFRRTDVSIKGRVRMRWERSYNSALRLRSSTPFGRGWHNQYYSTLSELENGFAFKTPEGDEVRFDISRERLSRGDIARDLASCQELGWSNGRFVITRWDHSTRRVERYVYRPKASFVNLPLDSIQNAAGESLHLLWDSDGALIEVAQQIEGRRLAFTYTPLKKLEAVLLLARSGRQYRLAEYGYSEGGDLTWARDAAGFEDRYTYDENGLLVREALKDGGVFTFRYDKQERCTFTEGSGGFDAKRLQYSVGLGLTEVKDTRQNRTFYRWNDRGQVVQSIDPLGAIRITDYDHVGRPTSKTDALGGVSRFVYDVAGNCEQVINAAGGVIATAFDDAHRPLTIKDAAGNLWRRSYDSNGRLVVFTDPLNQTWRLTFDSAGNLIAITDPDGASKRQRHSESGELIASSDWHDNWTSYKLDDFGRVVEKTDPLGYTSKYAYTARGELREIQNADGAKTVLSYDAAGSLTAVLEPGGRQTSMAYGTCRRLLKRTDPLGNSVVYQWGYEPRMLESITNESGDVYRFEYDANLRIKTEKSFDGRFLEYGYDLEGRCSSFRNGAGETITYVRDQVGRLLEEHLPDGSASIFQYNASGYMVSASNETCNLQFERDPLGRVLSESQGAYQVQKHFAKGGRNSGLSTSLGFSAEYSFDNNALVSAIDLNDGQTFTFQRDARGRDVNQLFGRNLRLSKDYDANGRLKVQRFSRLQSNSPRSNAGRAILSIQYEYDLNGALVSELRDGQETTDYQYDLAEHLRLTNKHDGESETFEFDPAGNVTQIALHGQPKEALTYEPGGRVRTFSNNEYSYDGQGRMIERASLSDPESLSDVWSFGWNAKDELTSVSDPTGKTWRYAYDALGRRVQKIGPFSRTEYVWDGDKLLHEVPDNTSPVSWVYSPHSYSPMARVEDGNVSHIITDRIGKPLDAVGTAGDQIWSATYAAYGQAMEKGIRQLCPFRFPGQWFDPETGLHYNRFRYYDPKVGRYISPDPIGIRGGNNLYGYALNPINWVDPFGLAEEGCGSEDEDEKPPRKVWTSDDPHTADLANEIEGLYPGHVVGVGTRPAGPHGTDLDIETQNAIIQIKSGNGAGLGRQITSSQQPDVNPTGKPVIGFAPDMGPHAAREVNNRGGIAAGGVASDRQTLLGVLAPDPPK